LWVKIEEEEEGSNDGGILGLKKKGTRRLIWVKIVSNYK